MDTTRPAANNKSLTPQGVIVLHKEEVVGNGRDRGGIRGDQRGIRAISENRSQVLVGSQIQAPEGAVGFQKEPILGAAENLGDAGGQRRGSIVGGQLPCHAILREVRRRSIVVVHTDRLDIVDVRNLAASVVP